MQQLSSLNILLSTLSSNTLEPYSSRRMTDLIATALYDTRVWKKPATVSYSVVPCELRTEGLRMRSLCLCYFFTISFSVLLQLLVGS